MNIGIVGHGVVGSAMARLFARHSGHQVSIYDKFQQPYTGEERKAAINRCDLVFVAVPTPTRSDGLSCDLTAIEECLEWITPPICIRSTIVPGTVDRLTALTGLAVAFSPEYLGEHPSHPWHEEAACGFMIVGGPMHICELITSAYACIPNVKLTYHYTSSRTAELCKYMENCFLATKVAFVNQFYDIAKALDVDFQELRCLWLLDPRVGLSHSVVTSERGFGGRCLPKDLAAIIALMNSKGGAPLLRAVMEYNAELCQMPRVAGSAGGCG